MFDEKAAKERLNSLDSPQKPLGKTFSGMNLHELLAVRAEIDTYLPAQELKDVDIEGELLMQFHQTKALLASVIDDVDTPANQKAQLVNTCSSILSEITKSQTSLYNAERLKIMEQALINALKTVPDSISEAFLDNYERELERMKVN